MKEVDFNGLERSFFKHIEHIGVADFERNTIEWWLEENNADFEHDDINDMLEEMFADCLQEHIDDPDDDWYENATAIKLQTLYDLFSESDTHNAVRSLFEQLNKITILKGELK